MKKGGWGLIGYTVSILQRSMWSVGGGGCMQPTVLRGASVFSWHVCGSETAVLLRVLCLVCLVHTSGHY